MSLFGLNKPKARYGALIDIGSGSVLVSIVFSDPIKKYPQIIWTHREHAPLRNIDSIEQSAKAVMTALVNTAMILETEGRKVLNDFDPDSELSELQCSISAPWSYTVTKTINYSQKNEFVISEELITELYQAIEKKVDDELKENETVQDLGLQTITKLKIGLSANGYGIKYPEGNSCKNLTITQANAITQQYLIEAINELQQKLFSKTKYRKLSFILMLYTITHELLNKRNDECLVDITYEAIEMGIVRDGILVYCTHIPFGSFSLTREISKITGVPLHEAFGYIHTEKPYAFMNSLTKQQKADVESVFEAYTERISDLFKETGDNLSAPKQISLHTDIKNEFLFKDLLQKAIARNIKTTPTINSISKEIIDKFYSETTKDTKQEISVDTTVLLSAQFFHNIEKHNTYEYL